MPTDAADLFNDKNAHGRTSGEANNSRKSTNGEPQAKRTKLDKENQVPCQALNQNGVSIIDKVPLSVTWRVAASGNKGMSYYTNLATDTNDPHHDNHIGIDISQLAEGVLCGIDRLESRDTRSLLQGIQLERATTEAVELRPHLEVINRGRGSVEGKGQSNGPFDLGGVERETQSNPTNHG